VVSESFATGLAKELLSSPQALNKEIIAGNNNKRHDNFICFSTKHTLLNQSNWGCNFYYCSFIFSINKEP